MMIYQTNEDNLQFATCRIPGGTSVLFCGVFHQGYPKRRNRTFSLRNRDVFHPKGTADSAVVHQGYPAGMDPHRSTQCDHFMSFFFSRCMVQSATEKLLVNIRSVWWNDGRGWSPLVPIRSLCSRRIESNTWRMFETERVGSWTWHHPQVSWISTSRPGADELTQEDKVILP